MMGKRKNRSSYDSQTRADKKESAKVIAEMPEQLREVISSVRVSGGFCAAVKLKRNAPDDAKALAEEIADQIESILGASYHIGVYRLNREVIYHRFR